MPRVTMPDRIPITVYPTVTRARTYRLNPNHTGSRRRPNCDSNTDLSLRSRTGQKHYDNQ